MDLTGKLSFKRTNSKNSDFITLVELLDRELAEADGEDHSFYAVYNKIDMIQHVLVCYENDQAIGCGAIKMFNSEKMEVKRMYVRTDHRNKGFASLLLSQLEIWAKELGMSGCILETGKKQPDAIALYLKNGYHIISNYGQYAGVENSVCFCKSL